MGQRQFRNGEFGDKFASLDPIDGGHGSFTYKADACFRRHAIPRTDMNMTAEETRRSRRDRGWYTKEFGLQARVRDIIEGPDKEIFRKFLRRFKNAQLCEVVRVFNLIRERRLARIAP